MRRLFALAVLSLFVFGAPAVASEWATDDGSGCAVWHGHPSPPANWSIAWSGDCENGRGTGQGILLILADGKETARYEGALVNGKPQGRGVFIKANGDSYQGDFDKGKFDGKGILISETGARYEGDFKNGTMHGRGVITMPDGTRYEGKFLNGMPAGQ